MSWQRWYQKNRHAERRRARQNQVEARIAKDGGVCIVPSWGEPCGEPIVEIRKVPNFMNGGRGFRYAGLCEVHYHRYATTGDAARMAMTDRHDGPTQARYRDSDGLFEDEDPRTAILVADVACEICGEQLATHAVGVHGKLGVTIA